MHFKPIADRVLIRRAEAETRTVSGFFIPDAVAEKANKGTVLALGPGRALKDGRVIPIADITIGDIIMYSPGAGIPVKVDGEEFIILTEDEIIAVVE